MTFVIVLVWIVIGFLVTGFVGAELGPLFGWRDMEGASAIFGLLVVAPLGGVAAGVAAYFQAQRHAGDPAALRRFGRITLLVVAGFAILPLGWMLHEKIATWDQLYADGHPAALSFEIRLPDAMAAPTKRQDVVVGLRSDKEMRDAVLWDASWLRRSRDRFILSGEIKVYYATANRVVALRIGEGVTYLFKVPFPARPGERSGYGEWLRVDAVEDTAGGAPRKPLPAEAIDIRYSFFLVN